jgi:hypothetical protein
VKDKVVLAAAATLLAGVLSGCGGGGGDTEAYCDNLDQAKTDIEALSAQDIGKFDQAFETIHQVAEDAPDEVQDDWKVLDDALTEIETALEDAGLELSDLGGLQSGQIPEGVDQAKLLALGEKVQSIASDEVEQAGDNIQKHAKDECDIDLSTS